MLGGGRPLSRARRPQKPHGSAKHHAGGGVQFATLLAVPAAAMAAPACEPSDGRENTAPPPAGDGSSACPARKCPAPRVNKGVPDSGEARYRRYACGQCHDARSSYDAPKAHDAAAWRAPHGGRHGSSVRKGEGRFSHPQRFGPQGAADADGPAAAVAEGGGLRCRKVRGHRAVRRPAPERKQLHAAGLHRDAGPFAPRRAPAEKGGGEYHDWRNLGPPAGATFDASPACSMTRRFAVPRCGPVQSPPPPHPPPHPPSPLSASLPPSMPPVAPSAPAPERSPPQ